MLRKILRGLASVIATALVVPFIQTPAAKLAEKIGFDTELSTRWGPLVAFLASLQHSLTYVSLVGLACGIAVGFWADALLKRQEEPRPTTNEKELAVKISQLKASSVPVSLRLEFYADKDIPTERRNENILSWYLFWGSRAEVSFLDINNRPSGGFQIPKCQALFIVFDQPTSFRQLVVQAGMAGFPSHEVKWVSQSWAVILINGHVPSGMVDIYSST